MNKTDKDLIIKRYRERLAKYGEDIKALALGTKERQLLRFRVLSEVGDLNNHSVLDLGCGRNSPIQHIPLLYSVGVELFKPYLEESKSRGLHSEYILADVREVGFKQDSFDAVLALELVEHLTKEEGAKLIEKMEKWAIKKIIISTPNRFLQQDEYDNNPLQIHKSGWSVEEFRKLGFKVYRINGSRILRRYKAELKFEPALLWRIISDMSQKVTYYFPKCAFGIFCVKPVRQD